MIFDLAFEDFITKVYKDVGALNQLSMTPVLQTKDRISRILLLGAIPFKQLELILTTNEIREVEIPKYINADFKKIGEKT